MSADLVAFLRARLDDDERIAAAVDSTPWRQGDAGSPEWDHHLVYVDQDVRVLHDLTEEEAAHVARHDPARVLAEVAAKRVILGWHSPTGSRDPETCELCGHGRAIHPDGEACVDSTCSCQGYLDDELMYPESAAFCGFCGPGDSWEARQEAEHYPHALWPCLHARLLAQPYAGHSDFDPAWAT